MSQRDDAFPSFSCSFVGYKKSLRRSCHLMPRMIWLAVSIVEQANTSPSKRTGSPEMTDMCGGNVIVRGRAVISGMFAGDLLVDGGTADCAAW
ncbi:hypothetical protein [Cupriavidus sp. SK-4]|uniref:hypothetical protein n=1 Tax=Cupriavidus sp. SK-4 TaxID=574750 RepID=UPI001267E852|nr:hypothetical protein [Cupriavidus sp. SK-4]